MFTYTQTSTLGMFSNGCCYPLKISKQLYLIVTIILLPLPSVLKYWISWCVCLLTRCSGKLQFTNKAKLCILQQTKQLPSSKHTFFPLNQNKNLPMVRNRSMVANKGRRSLPPPMQLSLLGLSIDASSVLNKDCTDKGLPAG